MDVSTSQLCNAQLSLHRYPRSSRLPGFRARLRRRPAARDRSRRHAHHHDRHFDREQPARGRVWRRNIRMFSPSSAFIRPTRRRRETMSSRRCASWRRVRASRRSARPVSIITICRARQLANERKDAGDFTRAPGGDGRRDRGRNSRRRASRANRRASFSSSSISRSS